MSFRVTGSLPLKPSLLQQLNGAGYRTSREILSATPVQLAQDLNITPQEALKIIHSTEQEENCASQLNAEDFQQHSALSLLRKASKDKQKSIITFSQAIDCGLFGNVGGVPIGQMTEFCGVPGVGKTQMSMQLAVNVQIPVDFGGVQGQCVYIDTEGSLSVERLEEMAEAMCRHLRKFAAHASKPFSLTTEDFLKNIFVFRVHDYAEQISIVKYLPSFFADHPKVRLVVMDSVAFHFRHGFEDMAKRSRMLSLMSQEMNRLVSEFHLACVVINQVTTKFSTQSSGEKKVQLVPALGESWSHAATNRVELYWDRGVRQAKLVKSPSHKVSTVAYRVSVDGIRDVRDAPGGKRARHDDVGSGEEAKSSKKKKTPAST
jgi:RAD51-like protein 2